MINLKEIEGRLAIIRALESVKLRIESYSGTGGSYGMLGFKLYADAEQHEMPKEFCPAYKDHQSFFGQLPDAIADINEYIKGKLGYLIVAQQKAIKKLL